MKAKVQFKVLDAQAIERINASCLEQVIVTNTIPTDGKMADCPKLKSLSVATLLGEAIKRIYSDESVSSLFV